MCNKKRENNIENLGKTQQKLEKKKAQNLLKINEKYHKEKLLA